MEEAEPCLADGYQIPKKAGSRRTILIPIVLTSLCTSVFWWLLFLFHGDFIPHENISTMTLNCGNSTTEARALGCKFDVLSFLWVPEPCFDTEMIEAYKRDVNWHGYNDPESKQLLDLDEMSERIPPFTYYTTIREHAIHCAYIWQKQHKSYLNRGLYMDDNSASFHHTVHCSEVLMDTTDLDPNLLGAFETQTTLGFSSCLVEKELAPVSKN